MFDRARHVSGYACLALAALAVPVGAEEVLHLYGPSGPSPAMHEAATAFQQETGVRVEVTEGPSATWLDKARHDADLIYSSAEYMMTDFLRQIDGLKIDPETITPLYLRTAAILVRPGNPKEIRDFPDLLQPGLQVMVVHGSGQMGLWEDMAGKLGDIRSARALRKNITYIAATSDEAFAQWKVRPEIDAWITWNVWFRPLHDQALLVPVSEDFRVYRQCSIAITGRGLARPAARQFVEFLLSEEGAQIFDSWGWMKASPKPRMLSVEKDIWIVYQVRENQWKNGIGHGLHCMRSLLDRYERLGIPLSEVHLYVILEDEAACWGLNDAKYREATGQAQDNPNKDVIHALVQRGVHLEMCGCSAEEKGWTSKDLLPDLALIPCGCQRVVDLQLQGAASIQY